MVQQGNNPKTEAEMPWNAEEEESQAIAVQAPVTYETTTDDLGSGTAYIKVINPTTVEFLDEEIDTTLGTFWNEELGTLGKSLRMIPMGYLVNRVLRADPKNYKSEVVCFSRDGKVGIGQYDGQGVPNLPNAAVA